MHIAAGKPAKLFRGPAGLRAGWRLLIFMAILLPLSYCARRFTGLVYRILHIDLYSPGGGAVLGGSFVLALLLASMIMGKIESCFNARLRRSGEFLRISPL